jgi:hypothetical protein
MKELPLLLAYDDARQRISSRRQPSRAGSGNKFADYALALIIFQTKRHFPPLLRRAGKSFDASALRKLHFGKSVRAVTELEQTGKEQMIRVMVVLAEHSVLFYISNPAPGRFCFGHSTTEAAECRK